MYLKNTTKLSESLLTRSKEMIALYHQLYTEASLRNTTMFVAVDQLNPTVLQHIEKKLNVPATLTRGLEALHLVLQTNPVKPEVSTVEQLGFTLELIHTTLTDIYECAKDGVVSSKTPVYVTKNKNGIRLIEAILNGDDVVEPELGQLFDTARNGLRETVIQDMFYFFKKHTPATQVYA